MQYTYIFWSAIRYCHVYRRVFPIVLHLARYTQQKLSNRFLFPSTILQIPIVKRFLPFLLFLLCILT